MKTSYRLRSLQDKNIFGHHKKSRLLHEFDKVRNVSLLKGNNPFLSNTVYFMDKLYNFFRMNAKYLECLDVYNFFKGILINEGTKFEKINKDVKIQDIKLNDIVLVKALDFGEYHYFIGALPVNPNTNVDIYQSYGNKELYKHSIPYTEFMQLLNLSEYIDKRKVEYKDIHKKEDLKKNIVRIYERLYDKNFDSLIEQMNSSEEEDFKMTLDEIYEDLLTKFLQKDPEFNIILFRPTKEFNEEDIDGEILKSLNIKI